MSPERIGIGLFCLALFHTPDGKIFTVDTRAITAVRPVASEHGAHLAPGTNAILYAGGQKFGIHETLEDARLAIHNCIDGEK